MKLSRLFRVSALLMLAVMAVFMLSGCVPADASAEGAAGGGGMQMIIMMVALIAVFYFFMIRPENKKKNKAQQMRDSLSVGDTITTIGGIMGKIVCVKSNSIVIETSEDRVRMELTKWSVSSVGKQTDEPQ